MFIKQGENGNIIRQVETNLIPKDRVRIDGIGYDVVTHTFDLDDNTHVISLKKDYEGNEPK